VQTGIASAANRDTTGIHIQVRDFMIFLLFAWLWRFSWPGAESPMRTCKKFTSRSGRGGTSCNSAPARVVRTEANLVAQPVDRECDSAALIGCATGRLCLRAIRCLASLLRETAQALRCSGWRRSVSYTHL